MSSISIKTPITFDSGDGFTMLKTLPEVVKQNLKMLILTNPGERVMDPNFGVGIQKFLFSNFSENIEPEIKDKFYKLEPDTNTMSFRIIYYVPDIGVSDLLQFTI